MNKFSTEITVRVTDINYGGHLANDKVLAYFHEIRVRYLRALGLSEIDIGDGVSLTQLEAFLSYKGEGFLGDVLKAYAFISDFSRARFRMEYELVRIEDEQLIASGYTVLAGFSYQAKRPRRIPESFRDKVRIFQSANQ